MAIILEGSDNSPVMWGKIGSYIVQRTKLGKMYIRRFVSSTNPNSPAQQKQRSAMREAITRWTTYEKLNNKKVWDKLASEHNYRDSYRAFLSSFLILYQEKRGDFGDHNLALDYVKDIGNVIPYRESTNKKKSDKDSTLKIKAVFAYRKTNEFKVLLNASLSYLKVRGYITKVKYGLTPYIDAINEAELQAMGLVPI